MTVWPACLAGSKANATWIFFFLPSISAETSWSKLFVLVSHDGSKYHEVWSIAISSCHSLPFCDTFYSKIGLNIWWKSEEFAETGSCWSDNNVRVGNNKFKFYSQILLKLAIEIKKLYILLYNMFNDLVQSFLFFFFNFPQIANNFLVSQDPVQHLLFTFVCRMLTSFGGIFVVSK